MPVNIKELLVFRIIHVNNLAYILKHGIYCRNSHQVDPNYVNIGNTEIISRRDTVEAITGGVVNDYVPFYFGMRSPMLYNIATGYKVPKLPQADIIYICCTVDSLVQLPVWCFTDGNAAVKVTTFETDISKIDDLDWVSIYAQQWKNGTNNDSDRTRKKHAEFLVREHVPKHNICKVIVLNEAVRQRVEIVIAGSRLNIPVEVNPGNKYYY
jgi:hypothetical protein